MLNIFAWTLSLASMVSIILLYYPLVQLNSKSSTLHNALFDALGRIVWPLALCYIIFACIHNHGGPINALLSHPCWQPISRISYSIFMTHFFVIRITTISTKTSIVVNDWIIVRMLLIRSKRLKLIIKIVSLPQFQTFIVNIVLTIMVAIVTTLAFESPLIIMEKWFFAPANKQQSHVEAMKERKQLLYKI